MQYSENVFMMQDAENAHCLIQNAKSDANSLGCIYYMCVNIFFT